MKYFIIIFLMTLCIAASNFFCNNKHSQIPGDEIALGKTLFFDTLLSSTKKISCATCHKPNFAFADTSMVSLGVFNRKGVRNTPSAMNVNNAAFFFWDGRAATLEEQALMPIANPDEMNLPVDSAVHRLQQSEFYQKAFQNIYKQQPSAKALSHALAAFEQSLETGDTPLDR